MNNLYSSTPILAALMLERPASAGTELMRDRVETWTQVRQHRVMVTTPVPVLALEPTAVHDPPWVATRQARLEGGR